MDDALSIDPLSARIPQVVRERRPRRHTSSFYGACLDQRPRPVANRRNRLPCLDEGLHETHSCGVDPELVRIHHAAGEQQCVVFICIRTVQLTIDGNTLPPIVVLPALHSEILRRHDIYLSARCLERLLGFQQFALLESVLDECRDALIAQFICHYEHLLWLPERFCKGRTKCIW